MFLLPVCRLQKFLHCAGTPVKGGISRLRFAFPGKGRYINPGTVERMYRKGSGSRARRGNLRVFMTEKRWIWILKLSVNLFMIVSLLCWPYCLFSGCGCFRIAATFFRASGIFRLSPGGILPENDPVSSVSPRELKHLRDVLNALEKENHAEEK